MPKYYTVCSRKTIISPAGEKKIYHKVGVIKATDSHGWYLQLYSQPNTDFVIFPKDNEELPTINFEADYES